MTGPLLLRHASTAPGLEVDMGIVGGVIVHSTAVPPSAEAVDLEGRPVITGLADHHIHLHALAAAASSVDCSPVAIGSAGGLGAVLHSARAGRPHGWLRGVGYDVATDGPIDRDLLDAIAAGPVRIQDRTGTLWVLDSEALRQVLPADPRDHPSGMESVDGRPTGVFRREDRWLRDRVPHSPPDLTAVGRQLAAFGLTSVTDAGADNDAVTIAALAAAGLPLRVTAMTRDADVSPVGDVTIGPVKVLLDDTQLPDLDDLTTRAAEAHAAGRQVAVHCVTPVQTVLALSAGLHPGDRIEHASHVTPDLDALLLAAGVTAVVQPGLVRTRGDRYLAQNPPDEHPSLHRLGTLLRAGVPVAASSDAPYGDPDPWLSIASAVDRRTAGGVPFNPGEAVRVDVALSLHSGTARVPRQRRTLSPGADADLVVLDDQWDALAHHPRIATTVLGGTPTHGRWPA